MFSFDFEVIVSAIRRIFRLKKFATVEFSAKQAFEDFDIAMLLLQLFLMIAIVVMIVVCINWVRRWLDTKVFHRAQILLARLEGQVIMIDQSEKVAKDQQMALTIGKKETLALLSKQFQKRRLEKKLGERHSNLILLEIDHLAKNELSLDEQLAIIYQIQQTVQIL